MAKKKNEYQSLVIFNEKLTTEEVKKLMSHKGPISYPNTEHNRIEIAKHIDNNLKNLRKKANN